MGEIYIPIGGKGSVPTTTNIQNLKETKSNDSKGSKTQDKSDSTALNDPRDTAAISQEAREEYPQKDKSVNNEYSERSTMGPDSPEEMKRNDARNKLPKDQMDKIRKVEDTYFEYRKRLEKGENMSTYDTQNIANLAAEVEKDGNLDLLEPGTRGFANNYGIGSKDAEKQNIFWNLLEILGQVMGRGGAKTRGK